MKTKKITIINYIFIFSTATIAHAHPGHEEHDHGPKYVSLSEKDIQFVVGHKNADLAYIPEIISELYILLKDIATPEEYSSELKEFMQLIDHGSRVTSCKIAMRGIFGALALLKKYESMLPKSYLDQMCDVLYGYQKSLHKEENVFQALDHTLSNDTL